MEDPIRTLFFVAYQAVGALAADAGKFDDEAVQLLLDYLIDAARGDALPGDPNDLIPINL